MKVPGGTKLDVPFSHPGLQPGRVGGVGFVIIRVAKRVSWFVKPAGFPIVS
jgi:hypothetical protein